MTKPLSQMTANEYKDWLLNNREEAAKLDESPTSPVLPTGTWRDGQWIPYSVAAPIEKPQ